MSRNEPSEDVGGLDPDVTGAPNRSDKVTIYDIAEKVGYAPSTVSRALSRPDRVSYRTAEAIRKAAEELGYTHGTKTRHLAGKTGIVALLVEDVTNPFFHEIIRGVDSVVTEHNQVLVTVDCKESPQRARAALKALPGHVDGLLLAATRLANSEVAKIARKLPTVVIDRPISGVPSVVTDQHAAAGMVVEHLREQGAKSLTYFAGPEYSWAGSMRWRGIMDAAEAKTGAAGGQEIAAAQFRVKAPNRAGGIEAFEYWKDHRTDAVICFNALIANGFSEMAHRKGVLIPDSVLLAGFDNTIIAATSHPPLTAVAADPILLGKSGANRLEALLSDEVSAESLSPLMLRPSLTVRRSSQRMG